MKMSNKKYYLFSIIILVISLAFCLVDALVPLNIWTHPVLNFFFCAFLLFSIMAFILGIKNKSTWQFFLCGLLIGLCSLYVLLQYISVLISILVAVVLAIIISLISLIVVGNKTEDIALNKDKK